MSTLTVPDIPLDSDRPAQRPVSYTHLTLPTN